jgi:hypothetical protein
MNFTKKDAVICILLSLVVTSIYIPLFHDAVFVDDAYIYFRVISNILKGHGWAYNINETANPCSSPLYTIIITLFAWINKSLCSNFQILSFLRLPIDKIAALVCIICVNAIAIIQYFAFRKDRYEAFTIAIVCATCGIFMISAGMDCYLLIALIVASALAFVYNFSWISGILAGLVALTRLEGLAFIVIIIAINILYNRRFDWRIVLSFVLTVFPWYIFSWFYFDALLPNSITMKVFFANNSPGTILAHYIKDFSSQPIYPFITFPLFVFGCFTIIKDSFSGRLFPIIILLFGITQTIGYAIMKASPGFFWYFAPGNFAVNMAIVLGLFKIFNLLFKRINSFFQSRDININHYFYIKKISAFIFSTLVIICMLRIGISPVKSIEPYRSAKDYILVSKWINENTLPTDKVVCFEMGYVGFYSNREIRDPYGLIHLRALQMFKNKNDEWWYADRPEVIVSLAPYPKFKQPLLDEFFQMYSRVYNSGIVNVWYKNRSGGVLTP